MEEIDSSESETGFIYFNITYGSMHEYHEHAKFIFSLHSNMNANKHYH